MPIGFPSIIVTSGGITIPWVVGMNRLGDSIVDRQDTLIQLMHDHVLADLPHLADGATITVDFQGDPPDAFRMTEHIINPDGLPKYTTGSADRSVDIVFTHGVGTFTLMPNWATAVSSDSADYAPGATLKGFRLVANWGTDECEYAFVIRGDAPITTAG